MLSPQSAPTPPRISGKPAFLSNVDYIVEDCEFSAALDDRDPCEDATTPTESQLHLSLRKYKTTARDYLPNESPRHSSSIGVRRSVPFLFMQFLLLAGLLRLAPTSAATVAAAGGRASPLSVQQHQQHTAPLVAMTDVYDDNDVILTPISSSLMRQRRSLANGRWGLRPGKRFVPSSEFPSSAYPKTAKAQHSPSTELLDAVVVAPAELMPKIYEGLQNAVVADAPSGAAASLAAAVSDDEWARKLAASHENFRFFLVRDN